MTLTFMQIQEILGEELPGSARQHRSWWANDSVGHVQSRQWLDVGWRVSNIAMAEEKVTFTRIKERERLYIGFYSGVLQELRKVSPFQVREAGPDGLNWIVIAKLPSTGPQLGFLGYAFTWHERFRVEFYIDSYTKERNKRLFDMLYLRKDEIQEELRDIPGSLEWERIDDKRASRIALYHEGAIIDPPEKLGQLRTWAVDAMVRFQKAVDQHVSEVLTTITRVCESSKKNPLCMFCMTTARVVTTILRLRWVIHPASRSGDHRGCHDNSQTLLRLRLDTSIPVAYDTGVISCWPTIGTQRFTLIDRSYFI